MLSIKNPEDIQIKFRLKSLENNIILREYIKYFNISEDTLKFAPLKYKKPIFTTFKSENDSYYIFFEYENEVYCMNDLLFSEKVSEDELTGEELKEIEESVSLRIDEINKKLEITDIIDIKKIPVGIIKYIKD